MEGGKAGGEGEVEEDGGNGGGGKMGKEERKLGNEETEMG